MLQTFLTRSACLVFSLCVSCVLFAQTPVVRGAATLTEKTYPASNFHRIDLEDINGRVVVESGKSYQVLFEVNDNLIDYFQAVEYGGVLTVSKVAPGGRMPYLEGLRLTIHIRLPRLDSVRLHGNAQLQVLGIDGDAFVLQASGNCAVQLEGRVASLVVDHKGNGDVDARDVKAQHARIVTAGNGDVFISSSDSFEASLSGNGNVRNYGKGRAKVVAREGNGKVLGLQALSAQGRVDR